MAILLSLDLMCNQDMYRIGYSEDIHPFVNDRPLFLGGINIPYSRGLKGHSDADVVLHAITESILGALCLGDLGSNFPDTDQKYKGISSILLLKEVVLKMNEMNYEINNIDIQVALKEPCLAKYILIMRENISKILNTSIDNVSIKAMSYNGIGPIGLKEACKASSYVMLRSLR